MPARIVVVHDDPAFTEQVVPALRQAGHDVALFSNPMAALDTFEAAERIELLVTRVRFVAAKSHGISLALVAKSKQRNLKVLFTASREFAERVDGIGTFLPTPVAMPDFMQAVDRLLEAARATSGFT